MEYKDVSYKALSYVLVQDNVDVTPLEVIDTKVSHLTDELTLEYGILGTSHFLKVYKNDDIAFTELLSCSTVDDICAASAQIDIEDDFMTFDYNAVFNDIHYQGDIDIVKNVGDNIFHDKFQNMKQTGNLVTEFPSPSNLPAYTGIELIDFDEPKCLRIKTHHSYPNEQTIVRTTSRIYF